MLNDTASYDSTNNFPTISSVAGTGFELTAICLGHRRGWIPLSNAYEQVLYQLQAYNNQLSADQTSLTAAQTAHNNAGIAQYTAAIANDKSAVESDQASLTSLQKTQNADSYAISQDNTAPATITSL